MHKFQEIAEDDKHAEYEWEAGMAECWGILLAGLANILALYADDLRQREKYSESSEYYQASTKIHKDHTIILEERGFILTVKLFNEISIYVDYALESELTPQIYNKLKHFVDTLEKLKIDVPARWEKLNNPEKVLSTALELLNTAQMKIVLRPVTLDEVTYSKDRLFPKSPKSNPVKQDTFNEIPKRDTIRRRTKSCS